MTKEQLKELGLTEEQVEKVWSGIQEGFVTKSRFNEVNGELKISKDTIKERDEQLQNLKDSTADVDTLKDTIQKLQADNKKQTEDHAKEIYKLKVSSAVESALVSSKAINTKAVKALLDLEDAKLNEDGTIKGLAEQIKALQEAEDSKMLFIADDGNENSKVKGFKPSEKKDGNPTNTNNPFAKATFDLAKQAEMFKENPEQARAMAKAANYKI